MPHRVEQRAQLSRHLREAMWSEPAPIDPGQGWRRLYRQLLYSRVDEARRRRLRAWRSPEPWLVVQTALDRLAGERGSREWLRVEGLSGSRYYPEGTLSIERGEFDHPFLFVAGFPRSGTTSLQNLVLRRFPGHLPKGTWNEPPYSMNLWWFPKHDPRAAAAIADLKPDVARVVLAVRPAVDALASSVVFQGWFDRAWAEDQVRQWRAMLSIAARRSTVTITFEQLMSSSPAEVAKSIATTAGITSDGPALPADWEDLYLGGVQDGLVGSAERSNMPDPRRRDLLVAARAQVMDALGRTTLADLDDEYRTIAAP